LLHPVRANSAIETNGDGVLAFELMQNQMLALA
jgi:hypothetical protein